MRILQGCSAALRPCTERCREQAVGLESHTAADGSSLPSDSSSPPARGAGSRRPGAAQPCCRTRLAPGPGEPGARRLCSAACVLNHRSVPAMNGAFLHQPGASSTPAQRSQGWMGTAIPIPPLVCGCPGTAPVLAQGSGHKGPPARDGQDLGRRPLAGAGSQGNGAGQQAQSGPSPPMPKGCPPRARDCPSCTRDWADTAEAAAAKWE